MGGKSRLSILVADDDPGVIEDYRTILCPPKTNPAPDLDNPFRIEDELFGAALAHDAFPDVALTSVEPSVEAVAAVRRAVAENCTFAAVFLGAELRGDDRGFKAAEAIRALAPELPIVLVAARCGMHPADVCARLAPADRVFILVKPFHGAEIQQLALNLAARQITEQTARAAIGAARQVQGVPTISLRHAGTGPPMAGSAGDETLARHVVAAVERVRAVSGGAGRAPIEVRAPFGVWPARIEGGAIEIALERLLRGVVEATPPGGRIGVELANVRAGPPQRRRDIGHQAGDCIRVSVTFVVDGAPADESAPGPVVPAAFARLLPGLDAVQAVSGRAGGYVRLELAAGSRTVIAIHLPRHRYHGPGQASSVTGPAVSAEPHLSSAAGPPIDGGHAD